MCKRNAFLLALMLGLFASCDFNSKVANDSLYQIRVGEKMRFINEKGQIIIEPQFDGANGFFSEGVCFAKLGDKKGLIDKTGNFVLELPDSILRVGDFVGGVSTFNVSARATDPFDAFHWAGRYKVGVLNKKGQIVVSPVYDEIEIGQDGDNVYMIFKTDNNRSVLADMYGNIVSQEFDLIVPSNGLFAVQSNRKIGFIDRSGQLVIDTIYNDASLFSIDGVARVKKDGEHYFISKSGERILSVDSTITNMVCNRAVVILNGEKCLIDATGKKICDIDADKVYLFSPKDKLATIVKNGKAAKIDLDGNVVLQTDYSHIGEFVGGLAPVRKNMFDVGYIDIKGNEVISASYIKELPILIDERTKLRGVVSYGYGFGDMKQSYYDLQGNLIWIDINEEKKKDVSIPYGGDREDFIEYFDSKMSELDPIEGIYYKTDKNFYQDRDDLSKIGQNSTNSDFGAVVYYESVGGYIACVLGDESSWVNKFVKIGNSNSYAVQKIEKDEDYSSEGRVTIDDFNKFEFKLDRGHNDYYNFFVTYEFVRDYPAVADMEMAQRAEWTGSGFAIADGYIATNYHVTNGAKTIRIKGVNGDMEEAYKGFVVASDKEHDLSIVKIVDKDFEGFDAIPYKIGKTTVDVGDDIFVLGYPMTQTMGEEVKLTNGVISAASGYKGDASMYQISAAVQSGNSGGPLFNEDGAVIGVVCAKHAGAENANYAVKVSYLYSLITSSNLGIDISGNDKVKGKSLSKQVKKIKDFVYLIECSSK